MSISAPPSVGVLIVSYDSADDIARCLAALERSSHTSFTVTICENAGAEAYERLLRVAPSALSGGQPVQANLAPGNLGFAGGVNFCLDVAPASDSYWILNPDTEPHPEALAAMLERLSRGDCTIVGHDLVLPSGRLASRGGGRWARWSARAISIHHGSEREPRPHAATTEAQMHYAIGASMLVAAETFERAGRMRDDYFLYCEEAEWCLRAAAKGERLGYAPGALVTHAHGASTGGGGALRKRSRISVYLVERNRLLLTRDVFPAAMATAIPLSLIHLLFKYAKARAWRQAGYALAGWAAGLRGERGRPAWF